MPPGNPYLQVSMPSRVTAIYWEGAGGLASKGKLYKTVMASAWLSCTVEQPVGEPRSPPDDICGLFPPAIQPQYQP